MSDRIGAAVLGLGVGRMHAQAYHQLETADLVAVCDGQRDRLDPVAEEYGCRAYTDLDEMLADKNVQLISVATPHKSHAALAIRCMRAGKHVIVEKPLTVDLAEADEMLKVSNETGMTLGSVFQRRYWPAAMKVKDTIDAGKIGRPIMGIAQVSFPRSKVYYDRDPWRGSWEHEGGGVLTNQGIHTIDMFQWFMGGDPVEVIGRWANQTHPYVDIEDSAAAVIRFKSGALGVLSGTTSASWSHMSIVIHGAQGHSVGVMEEPEGAVGYNHVWNIPGEEGTVEKSLAEHIERGEYMFRIDNRPTGLGGTWTTAYQYKEPGVPNYHARQIADLVDSIRAGRRPLVDGYEGKKSVAILQAVYESNRTGQPIQLTGLNPE
ncbi:MAG: Gfo/Idh/MocA family oxidoreductase [Chloroflexi bacterium]|nr:Gfo/Idh/MocA family oxidoreductase [Chloroflexota bacterium]